MLSKYELPNNPNNLFVMNQQMKPPQQNNTTGKISLRIEIEVITNHLLLILGFVFNLFTIIVIVFNTSLHKSSSFYILSLVFSNIILLLDTLRSVLAWWYNLDMYLDIQYIINLTFKASILSLAMLTIDRYISIWSRNCIHKSINIIVLKCETAAKSVLVIWIMTCVITAMELHLYAQFAWDVPYEHNVDPVIEIFLISTFIFLVLPSILILYLGTLIIYELKKLQVIEALRDKDVESFRVLGEFSIF